MSEAASIAGFGALAAVAARTGTRSVVRRLRRNGSPLLRRVLIVGSPSDAQPYARLLNYESSFSLIVGFWAERNGKMAPVERPEAGVMRVVKDWVVDEVVVVSPPESLDLDELALHCAEMGITFRRLVRMPSAKVGQYRATVLDRGSYLLSLETVPHPKVSLAIKRGIDIAAAVVGLVFCAAVYLWYARRIRRETRASVFFRQERVGQNGRRFALYKFRSMYGDAEEKLKNLLGHNEMRGAIFKLRDDPRVTPVGGKLRRTHLDELPQFWNVLKSEMSLVGTRPPTPDEVARYEPHHRRRLSMKPGITGLWQVMGNGAVNDFEKVVTLDCEYIDNWSLWLDLKLIAKTGCKVLRRSGW